MIINSSAVESASFKSRTEAAWVKLSHKIFSQKGLDERDTDNPRDRYEIKVMRDAFLLDAVEKMDPDAAALAAVRRLDVKHATQGVF